MTRPLARRRPTPAANVALAAAINRALPGAALGVVFALAAALLLGCAAPNGGVDWTFPPIPFGVFFL